MREDRESIVNPKKLETGLRTNSAGILYILLLRIEAIGFPTFGLLLYIIIIGDIVMATESQASPPSGPRSLTITYTM